MRTKYGPINIATALVALAGVTRPPRRGRFWRSRGSRSKALSSAIVFPLTLLAFSLPPASPGYAATTLTVCGSGCDQTTIQGAIAAASDGDTISILDASHNEAGITVDKDVTIQGLGANKTVVNGSQSGSSVFSIAPGMTVTIQDLTISNGSSDGGGGIENGGTLTISDSALSGNSSPEGGGINNVGTLTISDSTLSGNSGAGLGGSGGGIENGGTLTISNSTLSGNSAGYYGVGGGIDSEAGTVTISDSTLSGNSAGVGVGIYNVGTATIKNSIIADTSSGFDCVGTMTALGANLDTDGSCGSTNFTQVTSAELNLGPLALNAPGATETQALLSPSVAIDAAPDCTDVSGNPVTTDQRGVARPDFGENVCDIGAYEYQETFAGKPGTTTCKGESVSALSQQYGTLAAAAAALHFPDVSALQQAIGQFCGA